MGDQEGRQSERIWDVGWEEPRAPEEMKKKGGKAEGLPPFLQGSLHPAYLSAQLGWILPSQCGPWKPVAQKQKKVAGLFTQVPPLRHGAGERRL